MRVNACATSVPLNPVATSSARRSRLKLSTMVKRRILRPSARFVRHKNVWTTCGLQRRQPRAPIAHLRRRGGFSRIDKPTEDILEQIERFRRKLSTQRAGRGPHTARRQRLNSLAHLGEGDDGRATQRQMGQADVLRLLRERIPGGTAASGFTYPGAYATAEDARRAVLTH